MHISSTFPAFLSFGLLASGLVVRDIEEDMRNGDTNTATRAVWQKNTGQAILHETTHPNVIARPHVNVEHVDPDSAATAELEDCKNSILANMCVTCPEGGDVVCIGETHYGFCDEGCAEPRRLREGMRCVNGRITGAKEWNG